MNTLLERLRRAMPAAFFLGLALVTAMSLMPAPAVPQAFQFWDKAQHALGYAALALSGCLAYPRHLPVVLAGLLAHGAAIEVMQETLTTTRFGDVLDWLADGVGILAGYLVRRYALPAAGR